MKGSSPVLTDATWEQNLGMLIRNNMENGVLIRNDMENGLSIRNDVDNDVETLIYN